MLGTHAGTKRIATTPKSDEKNATTLEKRNVGSQGQKSLKKKGLRNDNFIVNISYYENLLFFGFQCISHRVNIYIYIVQCMIMM